MVNDDQLIDWLVSTGGYDYDSSTDTWRKEGRNAIDLEREKLERGEVSGKARGLLKTLSSSPKIGSYRAELKNAAENINPILDRLASVKDIRETSDDVILEKLRRDFIPREYKSDTVEKALGTLKDDIKTKLGNIKREPLPLAEKLKKVRAKDVFQTIRDEISGIVDVRERGRIERALKQSVRKAESRIEDLESLRKKAVSLTPDEINIYSKSTVKGFAKKVLDAKTEEEIDLARKLLREKGFNIYSKTYRGGKGGVREYFRRGGGGVVNIVNE